MVKSWYLSGSKCFESIKKIGTGLNNFGRVQNISRHIGQGKKLNEKCFEILTNEKFDKNDQLHKNVQ